MGARKSAYEKVAKRYRPFAMYLISKAKNLRKNSGLPPVSQLIVELYLNQITSEILKNKYDQKSRTRHANAKPENQNSAPIDRMKLIKYSLLLSTTGHFETLDEQLAAMKEHHHEILREWSLDDSIPIELWEACFGSLNSKDPTSSLRRRMNTARKYLGNYGFGVLSIPIDYGSCESKQIEILSYWAIEHFARNKLSKDKKIRLTFLRRGEEMTTIPVWITKEFQDIMDVRNPIGILAADSKYKVAQNILIPNEKHLWASLVSEANYQ